MRRVAGGWSAVGFVGAAAFCVASVAFAQSEKDFGKAEYAAKCASCHGLSGKGDGPLSRTGELTRRPSDLTTLSKRNGGVFPAQRVYEIIDGRTEVGAHGLRDMPVWGADFRTRTPDLPAMPGMPGAYDFRGTMAHARILALVDYLDRIQER